ncbi:MAG: YidC/Oxa1 family membrane protein insertase [Anaerovoracaceae bacterium]|nr:YidC/Oxa1 family membrane protein insertase [Anaerovoracaceae bacterium]
MNAFLNILAKPIGYLLTFIYGLVGNYGLSIIILTLIVKFLIYPLYIRQIKSTTKMSLVQPKLQAIQNKYKDDKEMQNEKLAELYKEEGFNPMGGCLPMLIQMVIIFGLFALLQNPLAFIKNSNMIFAVHESFLWMPDLSQPDKWILPILAGIATYISFSMQSKQQMDTSQAGMGGMMKMMKYVFPVLIVLMGRTFPSGLTIYWAMSQVIQIFFNMRMNKIREEMLAEMKGRKNKGGKK